MIVSISHLEKKMGRPARQRFNTNQGPADEIKILAIPENERAWVELEVRIMATAAVRRMSLWMKSTPPVVGSVRYLVEDVFETLEHLQSRGLFELITAQRVLINCEMDTRAQ